MRTGEERYIPIKKVPECVKEICGRDVHAQTIFSWISKGLSGGRKLKSVMLGGRRYCIYTDIEEFLLGEDNDDPVAAAQS